MRPRARVDPDEVAEDRAEVVALLERARGQVGEWWPEAVARLEVLAAAEVPDVAAARRAWRYGHHITDEKASRWEAPR